MHLLEQGAQQQIYAALELDFLLKLAIMPDCHKGYTLPIGGVALLDSVISPTYVGYDIGCGMCYILTDILVKERFRTLKQKEKVFNDIYSKIPVGFTSREEPEGYFHEFPNASGDKNLKAKVDAKLRYQLGTLGGGNHFIELGENKDGYLTITIHSGSRNMGHSIASHYMGASKLGDPDLPQGFLHFSSDLGQQYFNDMQFALNYALHNRQRMMEAVLYILGYRLDIPKIIKNKMINENHNHAVIEGDGAILHRKGATQSEKGQIGIIPGNMRDGVFVTEGLGNEDYLWSSSHGAGRKFSRRQAKESISLDRFEKTMKGIVAKVKKETLDESPDAYKNVKDVLSFQEGVVVNTIDHAKPIINIKA